MKYKFFIILLFGFLNGYSQRQEDDCKRMIDSAISIKVNESFIQVKRNNTVSSSLKHLYLINENDLPYLYSSRLTEVKFKYINVYSPKSKKILKKGIFAWKILTSLTKDTFSITIIDFTITYKNRNYNYANGGGSKTLFRYSCQENRWILIESKSSGI